MLYKWLQFTYTASWWLHFTFFCSDNAGYLSKVLTTEEEIHKEKENYAANIYILVLTSNIGHSVENRLKFIDGKIYCILR